MTHVTCIKSILLYTIRGWSPTDRAGEWGRWECLACQTLCVH